MLKVSDWKGCESPHKKVFEGRYARVEPVNAELHGQALYDWDLENELKNPEHPGSVEKLIIRLERSQDAKDRILFVIIDKKTGSIIGHQSFYDVDVANGVCGIATSAPHIAQHPAAIEALCLFCNHLFIELGYRRISWQCDSQNTRAKSAAIRLGFTFEGVYRQYVIKNGINQNIAWFSMLDREWAARRETLENLLRCSEAGKAFPSESQD